MKKVFKWLIITLLTLIVIIALAGIYKFNYLSSQDGYDCDGNRITEVNQSINSQEEAL